MEPIPHFRNLSLNDIVYEDDNGIIQTEKWSSCELISKTHLVSDLGRVKTIPRITSHNIPIQERILVQTFTKDGYLAVKLLKNGDAPFSKTVHRLVALIFIPNPDNKPEVNHKKGIKTDNRRINLEWSTRSENLVHAIKSGLRKCKFGERHLNAKLTNAEVFEICNSDLNTYDLANKYNIDHTTVSNIKSGFSWSKVTNIEFVSKRTSPDKIVEIFNDKGSCAYLANKYSLSPMAIWRIKSGVSWKHITSHFPPNPKIKNRQ